MDNILGEEHTSSPSLLIDLNVDNSTIVNSASSTESLTSKTTGEDSDISSQFNSGRKIKRKTRKDDQGSSLESIVDLLKLKLEKKEIEKEQKEAELAELRTKEARAEERDEKYLMVLTKIAQTLITEKS